MYGFKITSAVQPLTCFLMHPDQWRFSHKMLITL